MTDACRQELRAQFGERVNFHHGRDPETLRSIRPCDQIEAGPGSNLTQLLGLVSHDRYQVGIFDHAGNSLDFVTEWQLDWETAREKLATTLGSLGHRPGAIRVKPFSGPNGPVLVDWPGLRIRPLHYPPRDDAETPEELAEIREFWQRWLRDGCCKLAWGYGCDVWLNRDGEVIST